MSLSERRPERRAVFRRVRIRHLAAVGDAMNPPISRAGAKGTAVAVPERSSFERSGCTTTARAECGGRHGGRVPFESVLGSPLSQSAPTLISNDRSRRSTCRPRRRRAPGIHPHCRRQTGAPSGPKACGRDRRTESRTRRSLGRRGMETSRRGERRLPSLILKNRALPADSNQDHGGARQIGASPGKRRRLASGYCG